MTLGFAGTPGNVNDEPQNYILNQIGQEIDHEKDTDEDGIPDYYEKIIGTNPNSMDSDSDGLPDGYEYFYLETDPALKDTDGNGIDDGEEDFDADGLENLQEYKLETNPFNKDTDGDSLSDGDEVNIYDTDPLLYDTDGDSLCDSDEIEIGLDPNNRYTHDNILDSEYKLWQNLNQQQVEDINFDRSAYEVEVNLFASGNIHTGLSVGSSDYDVALKDNRSIVSTPIQMKYQGGNIEKGKLIFTLNDELISNQASLYPSLNLGIERYCIFNYDEDINLLYPILTEYDEANNKLSTDITSDGTFCVIDLES